MNLNLICQFFTKTFRVLYIILAYKSIKHSGSLWNGWKCKQSKSAGSKFDHFVKLQRKNISLCKIISNDQHATQIVNVPIDSAIKSDLLRWDVQMTWKHRKMNQ